MKRSDAIKKLIHKVIRPTEVVSQEMYEAGFYHDRAEHLLKWLETELGMRPPSLPEEDCQAIMQVYQAGYTFNQWEEDIEKDEKVQEVKKRRKETAKLREQRRLKND